MDGNTILKFGIHKGKALKDVPHGWFVWMHDHKKLSGALKEYADKEVPILRFLAEKKPRE